MFDIVFIRVVLLLLACGISAYTDDKTGLIHNRVTYPLILIGAVLNLFTFSLISNLKIFGIAALIYGIGFLIYYFGKLGGGDIKLFIGIHLILPYYFDQIFILWVIISACLLSVLFVSISYLYKLSKKIKLNRKLLIKKRAPIFRSLLILALFIYFLVYSVNKINLSELIYLTIVPMFVGAIVMVFEDEIKKHIYLKKKSISKLEDGDVIATEFVSKSILYKLGLSNKFVIEEEDINRIKNMKKLDIKTIPIYDNLPRFGPYILLGVIFVLVFFIVLF